MSDKIMQMLAGWSEKRMLISDRNGSRSSGKRRGRTRRKDNTLRMWGREWVVADNKNTTLQESGRTLGSRPGANPGLPQFNESPNNK